jgi:hypothetical protein
MINISIIKPTDIIINSYKKQYENNHLMLIEHLKNYYIVRDIKVNQYMPLISKYDLNKDEDILEFRKEVIKISVVYPETIDIVLDGNDYPAGLVDQLFDKTMQISGLMEPTNVEFIQGYTSKPKDTIISNLKSKYPGALIVGLDTVVGYLIIKGMNADEYYNIRSEINEISLSGGLTEEELNKKMDGLIINKSVIWPENFSERYDNGTLPAGIPTIISTYILDAAGWGDPKVELID